MSLANAYTPSQLDGSTGVLFKTTTPSRLHPIAVASTMAVSLRNELAAEEAANGYGTAYATLADAARTRQSEIWVGPEGVHFGSSPDLVGWDNLTKRIACLSPALLAHEIRKEIVSAYEMYNVVDGVASQTIVERVGKALSIAIFGEERTPVFAEYQPLVGGGAEPTTVSMLNIAGHFTPLGDTLRVVLEVHPIGENNPYHVLRSYNFEFPRTSSEAPGIRALQIRPDSSHLESPGWMLQYAPKRAWNNVRWQLTAVTCDQPLGPMIAAAQGRTLYSNGTNYDLVNFAYSGGFGDAGVHGRAKSLTELTVLGLNVTANPRIGVPGGYTSAGPVKMFKGFVVGMPPGIDGLTYVCDTTDLYSQIETGIVTIPAKAVVLDWKGPALAAIAPDLPVDDAAKLVGIRVRSVLPAAGDFQVPLNPVDLLLLKDKAGDELNDAIFIQADGDRPAKTFKQASDVASGKRFGVYHVIYGIREDVDDIGRVHFSGSASAGYVVTCYNTAGAVTTATLDEAFWAYRSGASVTLGVSDGATLSSVLSAVFSMQPAEYAAVVDWDNLEDTLKESVIFGPGEWNYAALPVAEQAAMGMVWCNPDRQPFSAFIVGTLSYGRFIVKKLVPGVMAL